jgi:sulfide dehydrogenase [flavocytochrome c] flavoprotein subunit
MGRLSRRRFVQVLGAAGATALLGRSGPARAGATEGRVVVIGGGFGGASCARYLKRLEARLEVTLLEPNTRFITCPFSNAVLAGLYDMDFLTHGYDALREHHGVNVVHARATAIDPDTRTVTLADGATLPWDRLVVSPGIDIRWGAIQGYDQAASATIPHAWKAGEQTTLLRSQLEAMPDGGVVVMSAPRDPFRCPPGPYERASLIAHYLKQAKPRSKILLYDAKENFSKQGLFQQGWNALYPGMIEWIPESQGGEIEAVDVAGLTVHPTFGEPQKGDVINLIPPQHAAAIAIEAGLANEGGWCPVDQRSFESLQHPGVHVIGDAAITNPMPKSGFSASSQGKVCATAIVAALSGQEMPEPSYVNTCYSLLGPEYGISIAAVYRSGENGIYAVEGAGGVSPSDVPESFRRDEARYAVGWYQSITADIWG